MKVAIDLESLEVGAQIVTRGGLEGRVLCVDSKLIHHGENKPVVVAVESEKFGEVIYSVNALGRKGGSTCHDDIFLIKEAGWVNIFVGKDGWVACSNHFHPSKEAALSAVESESGDRFYCDVVEIGGTLNEH